MSTLLALACSLTLAAEPEAAQEPTVEAPSSHFFAPGVHVALNANLMADLSIGKYAYLGLAVQTFAIAHAISPSGGFPTSGTVFGGIALPLRRSEFWKLTLDVLPHVALIQLNGSVIFSGGVIGGLRLIHASGFTLGLKLPVFGYGGSVTVPRASVLFYYISSIFAVPLVTVGMTF